MRDILREYWSLWQPVCSWWRMPVTVCFPLFRACGTFVHPNGWRNGTGALHSHYPTLLLGGHPSPSLTARSATRERGLRNAHVMRLDKTMQKRSTGVSWKNRDPGLLKMVVVAGNNALSSWQSKKSQFFATQCSRLIWKVKIADENLPRIESNMMKQPSNGKVMTNVVSDIIMLTERNDFKSPRTKLGVTTRTWWVTSRLCQILALGIFLLSQLRISTQQFSELSGNQSYQHITHQRRVNCLGSSYF